MRGPASPAPSSGSQDGPGERRTLRRPWLARTLARPLEMLSRVEPISRSQLTRIDGDVEPPQLRDPARSNRRRCSPTSIVAARGSRARDSEGLSARHAEWTPRVVKARLPSGRWRAPEAGARILRL